MNQTAFVIAAYAVSLPALIALLVHSLLAMRKAERAVDDMGQKDA